MPSLFGCVGLLIVSGRRLRRAGKPLCIVFAYTGAWLICGKLPFHLGFAPALGESVQFIAHGRPASFVNTPLSQVQVPCIHPRMSPCYGIKLKVSI